MKRQRIPSVIRRQQLLSVARHLFAERGYGGTSTLDIGREAGVSETLVLKHFGTKEALFRAAVADPLIELITTTAQRAKERLAEGAFGTLDLDYTGVQAFLSEWARLIGEERRLLLSLVAEVHAFPDLGERLVTTLREHIDEMGRLVGLGAHRSGHYREFDGRVATYVALAAATIAPLIHDDPAPFLDEVMSLIFFGVVSESRRGELRASHGAGGVLSGNRPLLAAD